MNTKNYKLSVWPIRPVVPKDTPRSTLVYIVPVHMLKRAIISPPRVPVVASRGGRKPIASAMHLCSKENASYSAI